jgi:SAM-dependent methyltransferase
MVGPSESGAPASPRDDWEEHWRDYADAAARNPAQEYRRRLILNALAEHAPVRRLLDIGAGTGDLAAAVRRTFPDAEIRGTDISESGLAVAREKVPGATFFRRDLLHAHESEPEHGEWATHAVCSEVLEHVPDSVELLRHAKAYLTPGCFLVITVPGGPMSAFDRHIGHRRHFTPQDLRGVLGAAGFDVEGAWRAGFPFFNLYRLVVILRGVRLADDVSDEVESALARAVMAAFGILFRLNLPRSRWGWQVMAVARVPRQSADAG